MQNFGLFYFGKEKFFNFSVMSLPWLCVLLFQPMWLSSS
jgi:hypothetical protein